MSLCLFVWVFRRQAFQAASIFLLSAQQKEKKRHFAASINHHLFSFSCCFAIA